MSDRTRKLVAIRARTDHDLVVLVGRELDRGFTLVDVATSRNSPLFGQAVKAHDAAVAWLERVSSLEPGERQRMEERVKQLRRRLDEVPANAAVRAYPVSFAS